MKKLLSRAAAFRFGPAAFPLFLLGLCLLAYGPLITRLGFYWDDFPMNWIATTMGGEGLARYFSTNRPVWGLLYRLTTPLLGSRPLAWQGFAILLRWLTGLALWALLRLLWRNFAEPSADRESRGQFAAWAAALFVIYPGFSQQFIAFLYSHFYIILLAFLLSLILMLLAVRQGMHSRWFWPLTAAALLLSLLNLLSMEYFFLLDLLRPLLIWLVLSASVPDRPVGLKRARLKSVLLAWLPYLLLFAGAMYWRSVLFGFHTYQPALMSHLKADPLSAMAQLIPLMLSDLWKTGAAAWARLFILPSAAKIGAGHFQRYWLLVGLGIFTSALFLWLYRAHPVGSNPSDIRPNSRNRRGDTTILCRAVSPPDTVNREITALGGENPPLQDKDQDKSRTLSEWPTPSRWAWQPIALGLLALLIAGGPFWLTDLPIGLVFPNDRFTISFMLGASLLIAGLLALLPLPRWSKTGLLAVILGFAIGLQYQNAVAYSTDWSLQRSMFWQMVWRMPDLQPNTILISNELPIPHYSDNSLTAPLNWTYDPANDPAVMKYALLYPTLREERMLSSFKENQPVFIDYLATRFQGSTSQMIAFVYNPPGCLRILDPQIDGYNWNVPMYLKDHLSQVTIAPILPEPQPGKPAPRPPVQIYGAEIAHGWCYYFEKADLARQFGDWQEVARLGDEAFASSDYPNDPLERFTFIEGYAHSARWDSAIRQTQDAHSYSPRLMQPMLCRLWQRIEQNTPVTLEKQKALQPVQAELNCSQALK